MIISAHTVFKTIERKQGSERRGRRPLRFHRKVDVCEGRRFEGKPPYVFECVRRSQGSGRHRRRPLQFEHSVKHNADYG